MMASGHIIDLPGQARSRMELRTPWMHNKEGKTCKDTDAVSLPSMQKEKVSTLLVYYSMNLVPVNHRNGVAY